MRFWNCFAAVSVAALVVACSQGADESTGADESNVDVATTPGNIPLFEEQSVMAMRLEAPLQDLFAKIPAPVADEYAPGGFQVPDVSGLSAQGKITYTDAKGVHAVPVTITLRGNTSLFELKFPKLTLDVKKADAKGTVFEHSKKIKLGTHGGETDELTPLGRRINQDATHREAFAYRLLDALGVPTLKTRPALMTYVDTGTKKVAAANGAGELVRKAFFLEDDDDAAQRMGGTIVEDADEGGVDAIGDGWDERDIERIAFAEALLGNIDWQLDRQLWNIKAVKMTNGKVAFAPYDFDLASVVTAFEGEPYPLFFPNESREFRNVAADLTKVRTNGFQKALVDGIYAELLAKRATAEAAIAGSYLSAADKKIMALHLDALYATAAPKAFYLPMTSGPTQVYEDAKLTKALLPEGEIDDGAGNLLNCGQPLEVIEYSADKKAVHVRLLWNTFADKDNAWMATDGLIGADGTFPAEVDRCFIPGMD